MATPSLKHLLNHDDDTESVSVHQPILGWDENVFMEE